MGTQSCSETSSSTPTNSRWEFIHSNEVSGSWSNMNPWHQPNPNPNPNPTAGCTSSCEDDISISISFTNASNNSGLGVVDSPQEHAEPTSAITTTDLSGDPPSSENIHLWSQVLFSFGTNRDIRSRQDEGDNFLQALSSKSLTSEMFEPPCDYSKKADNSWDFTCPPSFNSLEKHSNNYRVEDSRLGNLPDMVSNWTIATPGAHLDRHIAPNTSSTSLNSTMDRYAESGHFHHMKQEPYNPSMYSGNSGEIGDGTTSYLPYYEQELKEENHQHLDMEVSASSFARSLHANGDGYHMGQYSTVVGENNNNKHYYGESDVAWSHERNFTDLKSFGGCNLNKPFMDFQPSSKLSLKSSITLDNKKQGQEILLAKGNGRGTGSAKEGKKKRSEDNSEGTLFKKPKNESSTASSPKTPAPKVKIGDRITALQQIVSPFGKTDTASVLLEAIGYIKFLQEQVQLLTNPYLKSGGNKQERSGWGGRFERKDDEKMMREVVVDLKSRGLCLVPTSSTPQIYRDNNAPDYWTPTYRGCFYR